MTDLQVIAPVLIRHADNGDRVLLFLFAVVMVFFLIWLNGREGDD